MVQERYLLVRGSVPTENIAKHNKDEHCYSRLVKLFKIVYLFSFLTARRGSRKGKGEEGERGGERHMDTTQKEDK